MIQLAQLLHSQKTGITSAAGSWNKLDELRKEGERIFSGKVEAEKVPGLYTSFKDHHAYHPVNHGSVILRRLFGSG